MSLRKRLTVQILGAAGLALLLGSTPAMAQNYGRHDGAWRADRISTMGRIEAVSREGDRFRITLDHGDYAYYVPMAVVGSRNLAVGAQVRLGGIVNGELVTVDSLGLPGEAYYTTDTAYRPVPFGSSGWMSGVVQRSDRHLGYLEVRDDQSGQIFKVDVRHMNMRRPVNIWGIRAGDHITINGNWENRDTFDARHVEY